MTVTTHNPTQQQTQFKDTAIHIANYLAKEAIWDKDRCNWIGHGIEVVNGNYQVVRRSFSRDFYNGTSGIAYFLATLLRFHQDPILEDLLEGTMRQVLSLGEDKDQIISNFGFHGGRLGVAYALKEVGKMRQRTDWQQAGDALLTKICQSDIQDPELDIIGGVAGAIPVFLKYYQEEQKADLPGNRHSLWPLFDRQSGKADFSLGLENSDVCPGTHGLFLTAMPVWHWPCWNCILSLKIPTFTPVL